MTIPTFPSLAGISWPLTRSPIWKTLKQESMSGKETRAPLYTFPRYKWSTTFELLRAASSFGEFQSLLGFFNSLNGGALPFYYIDTNDNFVTAQPLGTGDGATTTFQFVRSMGGFVEPVQSPNMTAGVLVYANGVLVPNGAGAGHWLNGPAGQVIFGTAPTAGVALTWTGNYYWLCRMDADTQDFSEFMGGMFSTSGLSFTSIKL